MTINASRLGAVVLIAFSSFFFFLAGNYPADAALFPRALLLSIIGLSVVLIIRSYQFEPYKALLAIQQKRQMLVCSLMAVAYVVSMPFIGYYAASAIFIIVFSVILRFQSKIVPLVLAFIYPLLVYVVFEYLLNTPVPSIGS